MYDAIVVGARCAGAPTAMLLARRGYDVLLVDRAVFPSDTLSGHYIMPPGVAALERWGLLQDVLDSGCPRITSWMFDNGAVSLFGAPAGAVSAVCPRRTVLDSILVDAAVAAGATLRTGFTVESLELDSGRVTGIRGHARNAPTRRACARLVIGADGRHSHVARRLEASTYIAVPPLTCGYYSYWSGMSLRADTEVYSAEGRFMVLAPTHGGLTLVYMAWPSDEFGYVRAHLRESVAEMFALAPSVAERAQHAQLAGRFCGTPDLPTYLRTPYGPGWALVGDAGFHKDPLLAQGIGDAFCDAERLASAVDLGLSGRLPLEVALAAYQAERDAAVREPLALDLDLARLSPSPQMQRAVAALPGDPLAAERFFGVMLGTIAPREFFGTRSGAVAG